MELDAQTLFDRLLLYSESGRGQLLPSFDYHSGVYFARELANRSDLPMNAIRQWIDLEYPDDYDGYDDIYGCVLAGMLGLEDMVPRLVNDLHLDADLLNEEAARALARIDTLEIVQRIEQEFDASEWHYRLFAGGVLSTIKHPSAEEIMIQPLRAEEDVSIRTTLADGLCKLLSVEGISDVKRVIHEGYDEMMLDLVESLYANCVINGVDDPDLSQWKAHLEGSDVPVNVEAEIRFG